MPYTYAPTTEDIAAHKAKLTASFRARRAREAARTLKERRHDYAESAANEAVKEAAQDLPPRSSHIRIYDPGDYDHGELTGQGERIHAAAYDEAGAQFDAVVALWRATPCTPDGDEAFVAVAARFGDDLADLLVDAKELEPGTAAMEWAERETGDAKSL